MVYGLVHNFYDFQPLLCRAEVYKTGQTHYFSIEKARKDLNYEPQFQNDMHTVSEEYKTPPTNSMRKHGTSCSSIFISILLGILIFSLIMSLLPTAG
ncbi:SDR42E1 [Bugula neritina]|uniref:SDR42E1 n=1 Tax=Bugula neritina TaxID=10212 RepID=A0A7J7JP07_BUGNE|nr:SDR42E1 [Bugula neritina]